MVIELILKNNGVIDLPSRISWELPGKPPEILKETLRANSETKLCLPLRLGEKIDVNKPLEVGLKINAGHLRELKINEKFSFLAMHRRGEPSEGKLPNSLEWSGRGSSGKDESAKALFDWDEKNLYLKITVADDVFYQTKSDGTVWLEDSVQIGFDTHPELKDLYSPLAGVFTKKITEMAFAKTPGKNLAWRHKTHNPEELALGDVSAAVHADIQRDEDKKATVYNLSIPWHEIGLARVEKGKTIGVSILVNDADGKGTQRVGRELFGGIMTGKDYRLYGMFTLR